MSSKRKVIMADPSFDERGVRPNIIPIGTGKVAAYLKKKFPAFDITIYKGITPLIAELEKGDVDIVGISSYMWNKNLCAAICDVAREYNPNALIVLGGPDVDDKPYDAKRYAAKYRSVGFLFCTKARLPLSK